MLIHILLLLANVFLRLVGLGLQILFELLVLVLVLLESFATFV